LQSDDAETWTATSVAFRDYGSLLLAQRIGVGCRHTN
jgi:hypothetical protein